MPFKRARGTFPPKRLDRSLFWNFKQALVQISALARPTCCQLDNSELYLNLIVSSKTSINTSSFISFLAKTNYLLTYKIRQNWLWVSCTAGFFKLKSLNIHQTAFTDQFTLRSWAFLITYTIVDDTFPQE